MPLTQLPPKAMVCPAMSQYQSRAVSIAMYLFHGYLYDKGQSHPLPKCCHCLKKKKKKVKQKKEVGRIQSLEQCWQPKADERLPRNPLGKLRRAGATGDTHVAAAVLAGERRRWCVLVPHAVG